MIPGHKATCKEHEDPIKAEDLACNIFCQKQLQVHPLVTMTNQFILQNQEKDKGYNTLQKQHENGIHHLSSDHTVLTQLFRDLLFVQQLLILNTLFLWLHPTDLDKQGL
jgi:hypothetical protein